MDRDSRLDKIFEIERQLPDYALAVLEQLCEVFHTMNLNNISQNEHEIPAFDPDQQNGSHDHEDNGQEPIDAANSEKVENHCEKETVHQMTIGCENTPNDLKPIAETSTNSEINEIFTEPKQPLHSTEMEFDKATSLADDLSTISLHTGVSSVPTYLIKNGYASEEDPDAHQCTIEEFAKRDEEVNISIRHQMIERLLQNAKLFEKEPITNRNDESDSMILAEMPEETLKLLNKKNPIQRSVWPEILNKKSVILVGCTDYYPHLIYLPPICGMIKTAQDQEEDDSDELEDMLGGPKVIILEQMRHNMEEISRIGTCYLGDIPPSPFVYFNDSYDSNGLDDTEYARCEIFVTMPHHICTSTDPQQLFPKSVQHVVINNFETIPLVERPVLLKILDSLKIPFIITSRYYIDDLKKVINKNPDVFVALESHFDLYFLSAPKGKWREIEISKLKSNDEKCKIVRRKLAKIAKMEQKRVVIACTTAEIAEHVSNEMHTKCILNQTPQNGAPKVLICSDDHLKEINVKTADHIIHYDLPDDFETFSFRYIVFTRSHSKLPADDSMNKKVQSKNKQLPPSTSPSSDILWAHDTNYGKQTIMSLFSRNCKLILETGQRSQLYEMARNVNADLPFCLEVSSHFSNIDHLLECKYRHFITPEMVPKVPKFVANAQCLVEILNALSPISFEMRIHQYKDSNGIWCAWNSADLFNGFSKELDEFHGKSFNPVQNMSDANKNALYVLRKANKFMRCTILDTNVAGNMHKVRVKLVDFGVQRIADVSDFGYLDEQFTKFPIQSTNVCLLNLIPWNAHSWNDDDTMYVTKLLGQNRTGELQNRYQISVEFDMEPNLIFISNLSTTGFDYAETIISKGIASKSDSNDFIQHVKGNKQ